METQTKWLGKVLCFVVVFVLFILFLFDPSQHNHIWTGCGISKQLDFGCSTPTSLSQKWATRIAANSFIM
jgi:hypothetical protein